MEMSEHEWLGVVLPALHRMGGYARSILDKVSVVGGTARLLVAEVDSLKSRPDFLTQARSDIESAKIRAQEARDMLDHLITVLKEVEKTYDAIPVKQSSD